MGYMRHHGIMVTASYGDHIEKAHKVAVGLFSHVSDIVDGVTNGVQSFFVAPDGSKEGWEESNNGDDSRDKFISYLEEQRYEDGSSPLDWAEVQYGDDGRETKIVRHSDQVTQTKEGVKNVSPT